MKLLVAFALFSFVAYASAGIIIPGLGLDGPIDLEESQRTNLEDVDTNAGLPANSELSPIRHRRVTCDILSLGTKWGSLSKVACPARCLAQGHKGGSCRDGVCICN